MLLLYIISVPSKGPNISSVNVINSTALNVTWEKLSPDYSNGDITKYEVCYDEKIFPSTVCPLKKEVKSTNTMIVLGDLKKATTYYIRVRAATKIGVGKLGIVKSNTTLEDSKCI